MSGKAVKTGGDMESRKSMASRLGVSRATKHMQLCFVYVQDLVASGVVRLRKIRTKDNLADPHTKYLSLHRGRYLAEVHHLRTSVDQYRMHTTLYYSSYAELSRQQHSCIAWSLDCFVVFLLKYYMPCFVS